MFLSALYRWLFPVSYALPKDEKEKQQVLQQLAVVVVSGETVRLVLCSTTVLTLCETGVALWVLPYLPVVKLFLVLPSAVLFLCTAASGVYFLRKYNSLWQEIFQICVFAVLFEGFGLLLASVLCAYVLVAVPEGVVLGIHVAVSAAQIILLVFFYRFFVKAPERAQKSRGGGLHFSAVRGIGFMATVVLAVVLSVGGWSHWFVLLVLVLIRLGSPLLLARQLLQVRLRQEYLGL